MNKNLILIPLMFLLFACSKSDQEYVENCADQKTRSYWDSRANEFEMRNSGLGGLKLKKTLAKEKNDRAAIQKSIDRNNYYIDLYTNAHKKKLDQKMYEFPRYASNFEKCGKEFKDNPVYFKQRYE